MAEWWLLDAQTQRGIAANLDSTAMRVIQYYDSHRDENSLTAALCQELIREPIRLRDTTVSFHYRNFAEQNEEPRVGADGGILVTIVTRDERVEKGVLYQAKRLPQDRGARSLSIPREEASRLKRQIVAMLDHTHESILLGHTRTGIYAVDAAPLKELTIDELRYPFADARLIGLGTFLGKWVARCSRGDLDEGLIERIRTPRGFLLHLLEMEIETQQRPLLTEGGSPVALDHSRSGKVPQPRWRKSE
jgi:hypothetical protein